MEKKGKHILYDSQGKINLALILSLVFMFVMMLWAVNAMTVTLKTPTNVSFNDTSSRNINFTFEANWSFGGADPNIHENVSNCSLYTNTSYFTFDIVKNVSRNSMGEDNLLQNSSVGFSYLNYTYTK